MSVILCTVGRECVSQNAMGQVGDITECSGAGKGETCSQGCNGSSWGWCIFQNAVGRTGGWCVSQNAIGWAVHMLLECILVSVVCLCFHILTMIALIAVQSSVQTFLYNTILPFTPPATVDTLANRDSIFVDNNTGGLHMTTTYDVVGQPWSCTPPHFKYNIIELC